MSARSIYLAGVILLVGSLVIGQFAHAATPNDPPLRPSGLRELSHRVYLPVVLSKWRPLGVGLVTDIAGINDRSFNTLAWQGVLEAATQLGVVGKYLESQDQTDYIENLNQFVDEKQDLIITVGFRMGVDTANVARANPEADFAIVDYTYPDCWTGAEPGRDCGSETVIPNVRGLTFSTEQAAFLAGYLAAGMTTTGKVGTFGGMKIPTVTAFMVGYEQGVNYYNQQHGANVQVLGWKTNPTQDGCGTGTFTGNFESIVDGVIFAESLRNQGADVIFPVAGAVGLGAAQVCEDREMQFIGVDSDWYLYAPEYRQTYLTSVVKNVDVAVYDVIKSVSNGSFQGGTYMGTLANGGVGLAPYHDYEDNVSQGLRAELEQARQRIISGAIDPSPCH